AQSIRPFAPPFTDTLSRARRHSALQPDSALKTSRAVSPFPSQGREWLTSTAMFSVGRSPRGECTRVSLGGRRIRRLGASRARDRHAAAHFTVREDVEPEGIWAAVEASKPDSPRGESVIGRVPL